MENETTEITQQPLEITVQPMVEVQNISKRFPGVVALDDVSLQFFPGEVHAVVGENGAGKSTLMKIMSGAYTPDSGTIYLNGEKVSFSHPREAQEKGISIIYQEFNLLPERTVAHNIFLARESSRLGCSRYPEDEQTSGGSFERAWCGKNDLTDSAGQQPFSS